MGQAVDPQAGCSIYTCAAEGLLTLLCCARAAATPANYHTHVYVQKLILGVGGLWRCSATAAAPNFAYHGQLYDLSNLMPRIRTVTRQPAAMRKPVHGTVWARRRTILGGTAPQGRALRPRCKAQQKRRGLLNFIAEEIFAVPVRHSNLPFAARAPAQDDPPMAPNISSVLSHRQKQHGRAEVLLFSLRVLAK